MSARLLTKRYHELSYLDNLLVQEMFENCIDVNDLTESRPFIAGSDFVGSD